MPGSPADPVTGLHMEIPDRDGKHVLNVTHLEDRVKIEGTGSRHG